jgi:hypothetical protein
LNAARRFAECGLTLQYSLSRTRYCTRVLYFQPDQAGNNLIIPRRDLISLARADQDRTDQVASNLIRLGAT